MRKCDWTDCRQALNDNNFNAAVAVQSLLNRGFELRDVQEAQKELEARAQNPLIEKRCGKKTTHIVRGNLRIRRF